MAVEPGPQFEEFMNNSGFSTEDANNALRRGVQAENERKGKSIGEDLFKGVEGVLGSYKAHVQGEAYDRLRESGYGADDINIDEENNAYITHHHGDWHGKWYGGDYMDLFHKSKPDFAADVINVGASSHPEKRATNQTDLESWVNENGQDTLNWLKDY